MKAVRRMVLAAMLGLSVAACGALGGSAGSAGTAPTVPVATPSREPATLPELPKERAVLGAFAASGLTVRTVGGSKEESALGQRLPARVFIVTPSPITGGFGQGADVLFLQAGIGDIQVCDTPGTPSGRVVYTVYLNGQRVSSADAVAPIYHLVSADYFVLAYDTATRDALARGLGLTAARCTIR